jgi:hypothetical protein
MKNCYYYFFLEPIQEEYVDNDSVDSPTTILVYTDEKTYEVAIFSNDNRIYMFRIMIPNVLNDIISEEEGKIVNSLKEHMKSTLRIMYDHDVNIFPLYCCNLLEIDKTINFGVNMELHNYTPINLDKIRSAYMSTMSIRNQIKLLSDSQDRRIPLQYRFLSLYKLLELEFKYRGKWKSEFAEYIEKSEEDFQKLELSNKKLRNYIHDIRDRCAHIKTNKDIIGVTELDNQTQMEVNTFLNFLINLCSTLLNEKYGHENFIIGSINHNENWIKDK